MRKVFSVASSVEPAAIGLSGLYPSGLLEVHRDAVPSFMVRSAPSTPIDRFSADWPITAMRLISILVTGN